MGRRIEELKKFGWDVNGVTEFLQELKIELDGTTKKTTAVQPSKTSSLEVRIVNLLKKLGIPLNIRGAGYLREAIMYCIENDITPGKISITRDLYPMIAAKYRVTTSKVERAIRYAGHRMVDNCSCEVERVFGNSMNPNKGTFKNSEIIFTLTSYINLGEDLK